MTLLYHPYICSIKCFKINILSYPAFSWQIFWFPQACDKLESLSFLRRSEVGCKFSLFTSAVLLHAGIIDFPTTLAKTRARSCCPRFLPSWGGNQILTSLFLPVQWGNLWAADSEPLPAPPVRNWTNLSTGYEQRMDLKRNTLFKDRHVMTRNISWRCYLLRKYYQDAIAERKIQKHVIFPPELKLVFISLFI